MARSWTFGKTPGPAHEGESTATWLPARAGGATTHDVGLESVITESFPDGVTREPVFEMRTNQRTATPGSGRGQLKSGDVPLQPGTGDGVARSHAEFDLDVVPVPPSPRDQRGRDLPDDVVRVHPDGCL